MKNKPITKLIILAIFYVSCAKDKETIIQKTTKELLMTNNWIMSSYMMTPGLKDPNSSDTLTNIFAEYALCDKDDYITFKNNDTIVFNEGTLFCSKFDVQEFKGIYSIEDNNHFTTILPNDTVHYSIVDLNDNTLEVKFESFLQNQKQLNLIKYIKK